MGKEHILNYRTGYGYILFVIALFTLYLVRDWKNVLILLTAFSVGHAIALALSAAGITPVNQNVIGFLIPPIIFLTAVCNIFRSTEPSTRTLYINYGFALSFGFLQSLKFMNYLQTLSGKDNNIVKPLFAYCVGLEVGQLIIVAIFFSVAFMLVDLFTVDRRDWKLVLSSAMAGMALLLMKDKIFW